MYIKINNQIIYFKFYQGVNQKPLKPILVFLHGWQRSHQDFDIIAQNFNKIGFSTLLIDLPGFGKSNLPQFAWTIEDYADFLSDFLQKISKSSRFLQEHLSYILIGHSFGGRVVIKFAAKYPTMVKKMVLIASGGVKHKSLKIVLLRYLAKIMKFFLKTLRLSKLSQALQAMFSSPDYLALSGVMKQIFLNAINEDLTLQANKIKCPTLIIWGENDEELSPQDAFILGRTISDSSVKILENAGHFVFLEKSEDFFNILRKFI